MRMPLVLAALGALGLGAQTPQKLTLKEAEELAVQNHPRIKMAEWQARAAGAVTRQIKGTLQPNLSGSMTGSIADHGSRLGAGGLNAPDLFTRLGLGIAVTQMLYDFGRTSLQAAGSDAQAAARQQDISTQRAQILLRVRQSYFGVLRAQKTLTVTGSTLDSRKLLLRQITALAQSNLRSTLDVQFAEVSVSEAEILVARAENEVQTAMAELAAVLGYEDQRSFALGDEPMPEALPGDANALIQEAFQSRPELEASRRQVEAARRAEQSEGRLNRPTVTAMGAFGFIPAGDPRLRTRFGGLGVNLNIPVWNGHVNDSRREEAYFKMAAAEQELRDLEIRIARDVRVALHEAQNAERNLKLTPKLLENAARTLRLAQTRYSAGLGTIVELNQAELSRTAGEIADANARYDYQVRRSMLDFHLGKLR
ncbi:MAG: TolC family protein [Acidobacteria bacterium]|nr:TolC family protein [Acidobacteriota bacterium]